MSATEDPVKGKQNGVVSRKRKRVEQPSAVAVLPEEKEEKIGALREEMSGLFRFYKEFMEKDKDFVVKLLNSPSLDLAIAVLMEESSLPLSKLVGVIFEKLEGKFGISMASVKNKVILIGQRLYYGLPNVDADVLEDESESVLWCWETRDLKSMPKCTWNMLKLRRMCRKKIHERIVALSSMIDALQKSENPQNCKSELVKASQKLSKILNEADIRLLIESMAHKNGAEMADKEAKREKEQLIKQLEKNKREAEKEKKRLDQELQKEKLQNEKELKRLQDEAEKEKRRQEKEESEMRKQLKRQQEEAEKDQRRKEKEEAEFKRQLALQKQASLMERFLRKCKPSSASDGDHSPRKATASESSPDGNEKMHESSTQTMDSILSQKDQTDAGDILKSHLNSWRCLGRSIRRRRKMHWGVRQKPKKEVVQELKLSTNKEATHDDDPTAEKFVDGCVNSGIDSSLCHTNENTSFPNCQKRRRCKQLLQFDKSHRPAFYGFWPKKSQVVGARRPFIRDPELEYEIDSDEEWEEEEPGESLSDCDKDEEDENLEEGCSRGEDEGESEDDFLVPDGYLSEDEGVEVDKLQSDNLDEEAKSPPSSKNAPPNEFSILLRQQKHLHNLTEQALRKNQPLIILNFMHEKASLLLAEDLTGTEKVEKTCLLALSMCAFPNGPSIEVSISNKMEDEDQGACLSHTKGSTTPVATGAVISDSDVPEIISIIQSCPHGINKVVEVLQHKFSSIPKSQLRNKVREMAEFSENRWQVKKEILVKFGSPKSPEKVSAKRKSIATFFSKRCLPPSGKTIDPNETSPQSSRQQIAAIVPQQGCTYEHK